MLQCDDYVSFSLPGVDITVCFGSLFQRIVSINDGIQLSRLNQGKRIPGSN